jgi:hypothetical protein
MFIINLSPIQTLTVGAGFTPAPPSYNDGSRTYKAHALITVGRELHPAPKDLSNNYNIFDKI